MLYEEFDRLKGSKGISGTHLPVSDVGMIFINDIGVMLDENVRREAAHAIDKRQLWKDFCPVTVCRSTHC